MIRNILAYVIIATSANFNLPVHAEWTRVVNVDDFDGTKTIYSAVRSREGTRAFVLSKSESEPWVIGQIVGFQNPAKCINEFPKVELRIDDVTFDDPFGVVYATESRISGFFFAQESIISAIDNGNDLKFRLTGCNRYTEVIRFDISGSPDLNF